MSGAIKLPDVKRSLTRVDSKTGKTKETDQIGRPKSGLSREPVLDGDNLSSAYAELKEKHDQRKEAFDQVELLTTITCFINHCMRGPCFSGTLYLDTESFFACVVGDSFATSTRPQSKS
jgi:hypothetical protein